MGCRMGPITSSTAASSPSQPGSLLATVVAAQLVVACLADTPASAQACPGGHRGHPLTALCALLVSERRRLSLSGNRPLEYVSPSANSPCLSPFEQLD